MRNQPEQAAVLLDAALKEDPSNEKAYLYLGIIYEQLGKYAEAIDTMRKGVQLKGSLLPHFYFNMGNNYYKQNQYNLAEGMYSLCIGKNSKYESAYLNRANTRLTLKQYEGCLADYTLYLTLNPASSQKEAIEKIMALLRGRAAAEEEKRKELERQLELEKQKQKALLNDVMNSLQNVSDQTQNLSGGTEKIEKYKDDSDIMD